MSRAYYNEFDPGAAAWLRNLIAAGLIAPGDVDERSIEDVSPNDLAGYTQCHFFAGIGVWSYALRRAGWPDDRPVWTGSCPCQPFSSAGAQAGFADERHLWPAFHWLIEQCRPAVVFGEQVASKAVDPWIDLVQADVEALGYSFGGVAFPAASVGAPHIRDRLYWVADADSGQRQGLAVGGGDVGHRKNAGRSEGGGGPAACGEDDRLADAGLPQRKADGVPGGVHPQDSAARESSACGGLGRGVEDSGHESGHGDRGPGPVNGYWRAADWLFCRDGKWRPVEPGTFPLAHGAPARVVRLRAYGNAINAQAAQAFVESFVEAKRIASIL